MNLAQIGVTFDQIRVEEVNGKMEPLVNAEGLYAMICNAGTKEARKIKKIVDKVAREYSRSEPCLSINKCRERAIMKVFCVQHT